MPIRVPSLVHGVGLARQVILYLVYAIAGSTIASAQTGEQACGDPFKNHYGPWDYRTASAQHKQMVEGAHFTPGVETLTKPATTHEFMGDIAYTLNVFPNHHRALLSTVRLAEKRKRERYQGPDLRVECWFDRAVRYRPDDTVARALYAQFLASENRKSDAVYQLDVATSHAKDNAFSHYNIGLLYFELGEHDRAVKQAHRAEELGFPRRELAERLKSTGKWAERTPQ